MKELTAQAKPIQQPLIQSLQDRMCSLEQAIDGLTINVTGHQATFLPDGDVYQNETTSGDNGPAAVQPSASEVMDRHMDTLLEKFRKLERQCELYRKVF